MSDERDDDPAPYAVAFGHPRIRGWQADRAHEAAFTVDQLVHAVSVAECRDLTLEAESVYIDAFMPIVADSVIRASLGSDLARALVAALVQTFDRTQHLTKVGDGGAFLILPVRMGRHQDGTAIVRYLKISIQDKTATLENSP